jgi:hypothetical protein
MTVVKAYKQVQCIPHSIKKTRKFNKMRIQLQFDRLE